MTEAQANLDGLLNALDEDNFYEMLPIIADAYRDTKDWLAAECCDVILAKKGIAGYWPSRRPMAPSEWGPWLKAIISVMKMNHSQGIGL